MKLYWSSRSPYVRKVMICAYELSITDRIERVPAVVSLSEASPLVMGDNPLGKIPTLVLDDGRVLYDSIVICEYLDALTGGAKLFPRDGDARWRALRRHALGDGMLDTAILWRAELAKPEPRRTPEWLATFDLKIRNALDTIEADADALAHTPFDIAHVTIGVALKYIDFRFGHLGWRDARPKCSAWIQQFEQRDSAVKTAFIDA